MRPLASVKQVVPSAMLSRGAVLSALILEPLAQLVAVHDDDLELKAVEMRSDDVLRLGVGNEHGTPP